MWNRLVQLGVTGSMSIRSAKRIRMVNNLALTLMLIAIPCIFIFFFLGLPVQAGVMAGTVVSFMASMWLNSRNMYFPARLLLMPVVNVVIFYFCLVMGKEAGTHVVFLYAVVLPWFVFSEREIAYAIGSSLLSTACFYYAVFASHTPYLVWPAEMLRFSFVSSSASTFALLIITIRLFFNDSDRNEQFLNNTNKILSETQKKLRDTLTENEHVMGFAQVMYSNSNSIDELCNAGLEKLHALMGNTYGAILLHDKAADVLVVQAEWGSSSARPRDRVIPVGATLAGDAFQRQKVVRLGDLQPGYWTAATALGGAQPAELVILPMTFKTKVGVLELAFMHRPDDAEMAILQRLSVALAANILPLEGNVENARLVEMLQQQQTEMEASYAELQELRRKTALRASEQYDAQQTLIKQIVDKNKEKERELTDRIAELEDKLKKT